MKACETLFLFLCLHYTKEPQPNHQHSRSAVGISSGFIRLVLSVYSSEEAS